jgi:hypothetical protein
MYAQHAQMYCNCDVLNALYALAWMALVVDLHQTNELLLLLRTHKLSFPQMTVNYLRGKYDLGVGVRSPAISSSLI